MLKNLIIINKVKIIIIKYLAYISYLIKSKYIYILKIYGKTKERKDDLYENKNKIKLIYK